MPASTKTVALTDTSLHISRVFDAPRALVFKAWTDPQHLLQWFCPQGFRVLSFDADLRVGGQYRFTMQAPSGKNYAAGGVYREIAPPSRLVYSHVWEDNCSEERKDLIGMETLVTVDFSEQGDKTLVNFIHEGLPDRNTVVSHTGGWTSYLENLAEKLAA
jgi:uncharacterized protein YndB with AHSA1/START domain